MNFVVKKFLLAMEKSGNKNDEILPFATLMEDAMNEPLYFGARSGLRRIPYLIRVLSFIILAHLSRGDIALTFKQSDTIRSVFYFCCEYKWQEKRPGLPSLCFSVKGNNN